MYTKALEVSSLLLDTTEKEKQETERQRYNKCLKCLNQVRSIVSDEQQLRELEQIKHSLPLSITSPEEAHRSVQELTALKQKCPYCRELYLELANGYLLQGDEKRALEVLSSVMPNLQSALSSSTPHSASSTLTNPASSSILNPASPSTPNPAPPSTPNAYPFWIASWDADKLDLFNNDVSQVDVEFIAAWTRLFVMQKTPSMAVALWNLCLKEPRFRDWKTSDRLLQPFSFLSTWVVRLSCRWDVERLQLRKVALRLSRICEFPSFHSAVHRRHYTFLLSFRRLECTHHVQSEASLLRLFEQCPLRQSDERVLLAEGSLSLPLSALPRSHCRVRPRSRVAWRLLVVAAKTWRNVLSPSDV